MPIDNILRHAVRNGKNGVKNGVKNGIKNGVKNGIKNGVENGVENGLSTPYINEHLSKLRYNQSPVGRKGQVKNMKAFGYFLREKDPLITNKELNAAWDEAFGKNARFLDGEEYKYQPDGTKLTKETDISKAGMRPLKSKKATSMKIGKQRVSDNRKPFYTYMKEKHPEWLEDYTAKNARAKMLNREEIARRKAQGERVSDNAQFVMFEHDIAIRSPRWSKIKAANVPWNTYVNTNPRARAFKDSVESWFYTKIKKLGNNWDLRTNRSNMKDIEVHEISTGKLLFTIPFPEEFELGHNFAEYIDKAGILNQLKKLSTSSKS